MSQFIRPADRIPRPLTPAERDRLRARNGGFASPDLLETLSTVNTRNERHADRVASNRNRRGNNGWA